MAFRFKQFHVEDDRSSMKVGTDAVLLGAWTNVDNTSRILEVGSGSGIIALMLAQRSWAMITAVEIDDESCSQAADNFENSPWTQRLRMINISFQEFYKESSETYQLIVSNPPYFSNSLKSPYSKRNLSKHTQHLSFEALIYGSAKLIEPNGRLVVILPFSEKIHFENLARTEGFCLLKELQLIPVSGKSANRVILEFRRKKTQHPVSGSLIILEKDGKYTAAFRQLTAAFYLNFSASG